MKDSYSAQASRIMSKYKIRLGKDFDKDDTLARQGLEFEMNRLKEKQEASKFTNEFDNEFAQFENGGDINIKPSKVGTFTTAAKRRGMGVQEFASKVLSNKEKYSPEMVKKANFAHNAAGWKKKYGGSILPKYKWPDDENGYNMQLDNIENFYFDENNLISDPNYTSSPNVNPTLKNNDIYSSLAANIRARNKYSINDTDKNIKNDYLGNDTSTVNTNTNTNTNIDKLYEPTLSVVPLAASLLGNALLLGDNKAENIKYDRMKTKPELISLAREREAARREAELNRNIAGRTARNLGLSGGAAATIANATNVDISRGLGEQVGRSYLNEELSNSQTISRARMMDNQMNAEISMREKDANLKEKDAVASTKQQAIQNIIGNIGKYYSDSQSANEMNALTQAMSQDYNYYEKPGQSTLMKYLTGNSQNRYRKVSKDYTPPINS